ncbi:HHHH-motif protein [Burkholderia cenocepacia]|nr:HHHH-motif protein [Burkholderia cenocepacia]
MKALTTAAVAAAVRVPAITEAHPRRGCHFEHRWHKVFLWMR